MAEFYPKIEFVYDLHFLKISSLFYLLNTCMYIQFQSPIPLFHAVLDTKLDLDPILVEGNNVLVEFLQGFVTIVILSQHNLKDNRYLSSC